MGLARPPSADSRESPIWEKCFQQKSGGGSKFGSVQVGYQMPGRNTCQPCHLHHTESFFSQQRLTRASFWKSSFPPPWSILPPSIWVAANRPFGVGNLGHMVTSRPAQTGQHRTVAFEAVGSCHAASIAGNRGAEEGGSPLQAAPVPPWPDPAGRSRGAQDHGPGHGGRSGLSRCAS